MNFEGPSLPRISSMSLEDPSRQARWYFSHHLLCKKPSGYVSSPWIQEFMNPSASCSKLPSLSEHLQILRDEARSVQYCMSSFLRSPNHFLDILIFPQSRTRACYTLSVQHSRDIVSQAFVHVIWDTVILNDLRWARTSHMRKSGKVA